MGYLFSIKYESVSWRDNFITYYNIILFSSTSGNNAYIYTCMYKCMHYCLVDMLHHAAIDKGQSVRTVFVDFAKAFDHVDHNILVTKLVALGLPDVIVRWMCTFLRDRRQRVKIGDVLSEWLQLTAGMLQGSSLGSMMFVILINALQPGCLTLTTRR